MLLQELQVLLNKYRFTQNDYNFAMLLVGKLRSQSYMEGSDDARVKARQHARQGKPI